MSDSEFEKVPEVLEEQRKPGSFSFHPRDWPDYKTEVSMYFRISKVKLSSLKTQRYTLLYLMGVSRAEEIMYTFSDKVGDSTTVFELIDLFDAYFEPKRNEQYERGLFWDRDQKQFETNLDYVASLSDIVDYCGYATMRDEMLSDKLCHGMRDRKLAAKLRDNDDLTLEQVIKNMRVKDKLNAELKEKRLRQADHFSSRLNGELHDVVLVKSGKTAQSQSAQSLDQRWFKCKYCGSSEPHDSSKCVAKKRVCHKCSKVGHYARACTVQYSM